jgi:PAS domain S-box-containing protein
MLNKPTYDELEQKVKELEQGNVIHKQAEELLRRSETTLNATQQLAKIGGWEIDLENQITYWTDEVYRIHDLRSNRFTSIEKKDVDQTNQLKPDEFTSIDEAVKLSAECYDPLDRKKLMDAFQKCVENAQSYDMELPFTTVKGRRKWVRTISKPVMEGDKVIKIVGLLEDITERKKAEIALKDSEKKYRELTQSSNSIILKLDKNCNFTFINKFAQEFFGFSKDEIIGRSIFGTIVPEIESTGRNLKNTIDEIYDNPEAFAENENENIRKNGEIVWVAWKNKYIYDDSGKFLEMLCTGYDITNHKQTETAIEKERDLVAAILLWIESIVVVIDLDGTVISFNRAAEKCSGFSLEEMSEIPFWEILVPLKEKKAVKAAIQNVKTNTPTIENENHWVTKNGQKRLIHWYNSTLTSADGSIEYILCTGLDITERKKAENALAKAHDELEHKVVERTKELQQEINERKQIEIYLHEAKKEAETANQFKSDFLSNMSHEIRTPMHQILSYSTFGVDKIDKVKKEKLLHYFSKIGTIGKNLLSLLNDLLDLSKLESGKMDYDMKMTHPQSIISNIIGEFHSLISEKGIILEKNIASSISSIRCDEIKIGQVVRNLISNAVKFTPKDKKIIISIEQSDLQQADRIEIPALLVNVSDQGVGIPDDELKSVFDKFVQSSKTKTGSGGTGLGLAICKEIIEAHNGKIWAENITEGGSTFSFMLPYEQEMT